MICLHNKSVSIVDISTGPYGIHALRNVNICANLSKYVILNVLYFLFDVIEYITHTSQAVI